jgi:hypothetical protein
MMSAVLMRSANSSGFASSRVDDDSGMGILSVLMKADEASNHQTICGFQD